MAPLRRGTRDQNPRSDSQISNREFRNSVMNYDFGMKDELEFSLPRLLGLTRALFRLFCFGLKQINNFGHNR
jgi:hypothetical protein